MKYFFTITSIILVLHNNASEITIEEFPHIKPISVERLNSLSHMDMLIDADRDGIPDAKDDCLGTAENVKVDMFGCKVIIDDDKDGISNENDECPKTELGSTVNKKGCPLDTDADGVSDLKDECPNTDIDFVVDSAGCPQTAVLNVSFAVGKTKILAETLVRIEEFAQFLQDNKAYEVIIYGYTDDRGEKAKNKELSRHRAKAVMNALIDYGVKLTRLTAIGMGSKNPIAKNDTPENRAKNRRIEVELLQ